MSYFQTVCSANVRSGGIVKVEGGGGQIVRAVAQERSLTLQIITATVVVVKQLELSSCFCTFSQNIYSVISIKRAARLNVLRNFSNLLAILR